VPTRTNRMGEVMIDHRVSPGVDAEFARPRGAIPVPAGTLYEASTSTCSHCNRVTVCEAGVELPYCRGCDHYICRRCATVMAVTLTCEPLVSRFEKIAARAETRNVVLLGE